jgi:MFS transporter, PPP family, 3-phenylpropionic acid transporter
MIEVFYFFYFQSVAVYMTFMPPYLRGLGLTGREISTLYAIPPLLALAVPLAWATLADRTRRHDRVLRIVVGGACLGFVPLLFARSFAPILIGWITFAVFSVAVGGLADALAVARVRAGAIYGRLRLWGSVGYVVAAVAVGALLSARGHGADGIAPVALWLALVAAFIAALPLRGTGEDSARPSAGDVKALLAKPRLRLLLLAAALHWVCLTPYNVYFGVLMRDLGLSPNVWGLAFSTGVVAEVIVLAMFRRLEARFPLDVLLAAAFVASALRWLAISVVDATWALVALQAIHGLSFGLFWSAAIALIAATAPGSLRATGQALLVMSINLGGVIGNTVTGRLYDASGPRLMFVLAAILELAPLTVVLVARRRLRATAGLLSSGP